ncbi:MAG: alanine:cation symporter family protein [Endomicrobium sp.]|jgi:AGCS family alanine or glycine:cation symporter|nr:alanine:cation symporter family protein [Endomicrobium sp.]
MESLSIFVGQLISFAWGLPIVFIIPAYLYFTFKTKFIQKKLFKGLKLALTRQEQYGQGELSPFHTFCTELGVTFGVGNVIGVATAIIVGGVGAVFWVFAISFLGVSVKYCEAYISTKFRQKTITGDIVSGVVVVYDKVFKMKKVAILFAVLCLISSTVRLFSMQVRFICDFCNTTFDVPILPTELVVVSIIAFFVFLGTTFIAHFASKITIPVVCIYFILCFTILFTRLEYIVPALAAILRGTFSFESLSGGIIGSSIFMAFKEGSRIGLYSTEAGMGELSVVGAQAKTRNPFRQAIISSTITFLDGAVCCPLTGLVVVITLLHSPNLIDTSNISGKYIIDMAFSCIPKLGAPLLAMVVLVFAFTMAVTSYVVVKNFFVFLFKNVNIIKFKIIYLFCGSFIGLIFAKKEYWEFLYFIDVFKVGLTLWGIFLLRDIIIRETKEYSVGNRVDVIKDTVILYKEVEQNIQNKKIKISILK